MLPNSREPASELSRAGAPADSCFQSCRVSWKHEGPTVVKHNAVIIFRCHPCAAPKMTKQTPPTLLRLPRPEPHPLISAVKPGCKADSHLECFRAGMAQVRSCGRGGESA